MKKRQKDKKQRGQALTFTKDMLWRGERPFMHGVDKDIMG